MSVTEPYVPTWLRQSGTTFNGLPAVGIATIAALRLYIGPSTTAILTAEAIFGDGEGGVFAIKPLDTTTADDGEFVIVDALGRRWWRLDTTNTGAGADVSFATMAAMRLYKGAATTANVVARTTFGDGGGGTFAVKSGDTSTADDGALVLVDSLGRRWFRVYDGAFNVKWWGAIGDGFADDTAALQACLDALPVFRAELYIPAGDYLTGPLELPVIYNFTIKGAGRETTNISLTSAGTLLSISGANFSTISGIGFRLSGTAQAIAGTSGVRVYNQSGNVSFENCDFVGFADDGLFFDGTIATSTAASISGTVLTVGGAVTGVFAVGQTVGGAERGTIISSLGTGTGGVGTYNVTVSQTLGTTAVTGVVELSGAKVSGCYFLGSGRHQLRGYYSNDYVIDKNQIGRLFGIAHAATGMLLEGCGAGFIEKNTIWENVIGLRSVKSDYNSFVNNRIEINDQEGARFERGVDNIFEVNRLYSNSQSGDGLYSNAHFEDVDGFIFSGNKIFSWDGTSSRYGTAFAGTYNRVSVKGNRVDGFDVSNYGPYYFGATGMALGVHCDAILRFATAGTVAANTTVLVGLNDQQDTGYKTGFPLGGGRWQCIGGRMFASGAPVGVETFTYTIYRGTSDSTISATITGAVGDTYLTSPTLSVVMTDGTFPSMKVAASASATAAAHRGYIMLAEY